MVVLRTYNYRRIFFTEDAIVLCENVTIKLCVDFEKSLFMIKSFKSENIFMKRADCVNFIQLTKMKRGVSQLL